MAVGSSGQDFARHSCMLSMAHPLGFAFMHLLDIVEPYSFYLDPLRVFSGVLLERELFPVFVFVPLASLS